MPVPSVDQITYDINSLIPFDQFNWDCVDGLDCIYQDINKTYSSLATYLGNGTMDASKVATNIIANLTNHLTESVELSAKPWSDIISQLSRQISDSIAGVQNSGGNGVMPLRAWVVYRSDDKGTYYPVIEIWDRPPSGYLAYGPFTCVPALACTLNQVGQRLQKPDIDAGYNQAFADLLNSTYMGTNGVDHAGLLVNPNDICLDYPQGEQSYTTSQALTPSPCIAALPSMSPGESNAILPISSPDTISTTIPTSQSPLNIPTTSTPIDYNPAMVQSSQSQCPPISVSVSIPCCDDIVSLLKEIASRLPSQIMQSGDKGAAVASASGIPDDKYLISQEHLRDVGMYLSSTQGVSPVTGTEMTLVNALDEMLDNLKTNVQFE